MDFLALIPARYASTRLPGKPLLDIAGHPMIWHVCQRALESGANRVVVATDDKRILRVVRDFGVECLITSAGHSSGTDRLAEVVKRLRIDPSTTIVNVQGDEPLISGSLINRVAETLKKNPMASVATICEPIKLQSDLMDPNLVKVVMSKSGRALYFSRAPIPGSLDQEVGPHYRHVGLYAYSAGFLSEFVSWKPTKLERFEQLEQLRILSHDRIIQVIVAEESIPPGIDTEADLQFIRRYLDF